MRVLVDTSVWADFFNQFESPQTLILEKLIEEEVELLTCGVVIAEFFQGIRRVETIPELQEHFGFLGYLSPREPETYFVAASLFRELRARGVTIRSMVDCLIVRLAEEGNAFLLAKDRDMRAIVNSGLTRVLEWPQEWVEP